MQKSLDENVWMNLLKNSQESEQGFDRTPAVERNYTGSGGSGGSGGSSGGGGRPMYRGGKSFNKNVRLTETGDIHPEQIFPEKIIRYKTIGKGGIPKDATPGTYKVTYQELVGDERVGIPGKLILRNPRDPNMDPFRPRVPNQRTKDVIKGVGIGTAPGWMSLAYKLAKEAGRQYMNDPKDATYTDTSGGDEDVPTLTPEQYKQISQSSTNDVPTLTPEQYKQISQSSTKNEHTLTPAQYAKYMEDLIGLY